MSKKYIMVSLEDERAGKIAEILGNKSSKKIIDFLSDKNEASEKEIAEKLKMPINTVEYNLNKLLHVEMIEKTKIFFWSSRGKKIPTYRLSNKSIIISPKKRISSQIKTLFPVMIISVIATFLVRQFTIGNISEETADKGLMFASAPTTEMISFSQSPVWIWFLLGTLFAIVLFILISIIKTMKENGIFSLKHQRYLKGGSNN